MNYTSLNTIYHRIHTDYLEPALRHPIGYFTYALTAEVVKIVTAKLFLDLLSRCIFGKELSSTDKVWSSVILAPVVEEIIMRFVVLQGIKLFQEPEDHLSEKERRLQKIYRVHLSALAFGAIHLLNPQKPLSALIHCISATLTGVTLGHLAEKYHTIAISIVFHGLHNLIGVRYSHSKTVWLPLISIVNRCAFYVLATTNIDEIIISKCRQVFNFRREAQNQAVNPMPV